MELPNIGEPFGEVIGGKIYINAVWYEALKLQPYIMPSKAQLDFASESGVMFNSGNSAQGNARDAHTRISRLASFISALMLSLEGASVYPGWSDS